MDIHSIDHIVLVVADPAKTCAFYRDVLGMQPEQNANGKWSLRFGPHKLNLQVEGAVPPKARQTTRGSANFCVLTDTPIEEVAATLEQHSVEILEGPARKEGATGPLASVYFYDVDGNLVEVSNRLEE